MDDVAEYYDRIVDINPAFDWGSHLWRVLYFYGLIDGVTQHYVFTFTPFIDVRDNAF